MTYTLVMTRTAYIQVRLTPEEKGRLRFEAGDQSLSDYIRSKVFPEPRERWAPSSDVPAADRIKLEARIKQLVTQGLTTPAARLEAVKELLSQKG